jgi:hypothetical protein
MLLVSAKLMLSLDLFYGIRIFLQSRFCFLHRILDLVLGLLFDNIYRSVLFYYQTERQHFVSSAAFTCYRSQAHLASFVGFFLFASSISLRSM